MRDKVAVISLATTRSKILAERRCFPREEYRRLLPLGALPLLERIS